MENMARWDIGVVMINNDFRPLTNNMMPNKTFEYIGCGLPVLAYGTRGVGDFVEREGLGIYVDNLRDLDNIVDRLRMLKKNVCERRTDFVMENQVEELMKIYRG